MLGRFSKTVIPYGLDTDIFNNRNSDGLQEALGIPSDAFIIGFVADSLTNKRKGFAYLNNALNQLNNRKIYLVSIGGNSPALPDNLNHIHLGRIEQDRLLSLAFSLFDIFVCPSLEDNLPNTVLESLACGTPVVGFNTGGMPDMVDSGITGYLATDYSVESLRFCIEKALIEKNGLEAMAIDCREKVLNEDTLTKQADSYSKLYSSMLGRAC